MAFAAAIWMARKVSMQQKKSIPEESSLKAFCISFRPENKILLFPPAIETMRWLRMVVEQFWQVDTVDAREDCYTLHLTGAPFLKHSSRESAILLKTMCCQILETFKTQNWQLVLCTDLSCKSDLTAWYFARAHTSSMSLDVPDTPSASPAAFVCLSLSKNCKLQIVNASTELQDSLKSCIEASYPPGIDKDSRKGRDYEIKLKGTPWDPKNRLETVAACSLMINIFRRFHFNGFQLYGIVNLKETADSFIFEYDPRQTDENDRYMMIDIDESNLLRLVGAPDRVVEVVEETLKTYWEPGVASKVRIEVDDMMGAKFKQNRRKTIASSAWEFKLNGSPWYTKASKIGRSRQLMTYLLDNLMADGWTVASGLETSRASESKSDLLFQCCQPVPGLRHVCISPLGKNSIQIINAPLSLRQLIRTELGNIVTREKLSPDQTQYELTLIDFPWDPDPHTDHDSYTEVRRRMGALLQTLMDARWMVIASADVAHEAQEDAGDRVGIHSWFLIYTGPDERTGCGIRVTANSVLQVMGVAGRVGSSHSRMSEMK